MCDKELRRRRGAEMSKKNKNPTQRMWGKIFHIIGPQCLQCIRTIPYFGPQCLQCIKTIPYFGPQCLQCIRTIPYFGPQCLQCIRTIPYYWTSMPPMPQSYSIFWTSGDGDDDERGGGGFPRTLESGRSPGPTCPGTKYPVRGIPHFDVLKSSN